jgi:hypothetical protein
LAWPDDATLVLYRVRADAPFRQARHFFQGRRPGDAIMSNSASAVIQRLDAEVDAFSKRTRYFSEPYSKGRARMFVLQHRQNTRYRNSVLKLRVATNTPDWDIKLDIIGACAEEIIADEEFYGGRPHWAVLRDLGLRIGLGAEEIESATPLPTTQMAWLAWEALMSNRHWLEGLVANTCAERANVPGYGHEGATRERGWFGLEQRRWKELWPHSDVGWNAVAEHAERLAMEDAVVKACRVNLMVWEHYLNGIGDGADALDRGETLVAA